MSLNQIAGFIWGIADDVLRDLYVRGKYRDVILPMTLIRRLDAVLEPTKQAVLDMKASLDKAGIVSQDQALREAAGQAVYNTSKFTLRDLRNRASRQALKADFEAYLDGYSPNVQDILESFEFRNQIPRLSKADALGTLIEKFLAPGINLGPKPVMNPDGTEKLPGLDNHAMGTIFEELVRRFNEENNEEAGEHWTPRDAVKLMARLIFLPIADKIEDGTYLLYDGACGTGGMLTVAEETLKELAESHGKQVATHLYGQEINAETYAICKADLLLKGEGDAADNLVGGPEHSTLSNDAFPSREFDFMLSNPPYGKSWKSDLERMGGKKGLKDPRFVIEHAGDPEYSLVTRSSDGQMLFLANMLSKMKQETKLGSRIAEVHNGSSLFTGDAGQGESNIRRWIIENDWLEAIVALPLNMFYNTGIATYIWVLTNRKPVHRQGKVQLIDATQWFRPLRKNLGKKNCELSPEDIQKICDVFLAFEETEQSKIFSNEAFGYQKVTVDLSIRCHVSRSTTVSPSAIDLGPVAAASTHHRRIVVSTRKSERNALLATEGIETLRAVLSAPDTHNRVCFDVSLVAPLTPGPFSGSVSVRLLDTKEALTLPVRGTVLPALMLSPSYLVFDGSAERQIDIGTPSGHPANAPPSVLGLPTGLRSRTEHVPPKNWRMYFECDASAEPGAYECTVVLGQHEARLYLEIL